MDVPIQLNMFYNLSHFQKLKRIDSWERKRTKTKNSLWEEYERKILEVIGRNFKLYSREVKVDWIQKQDGFREIESRSGEGDKINEALNNLVTKGFLSADKKLTYEGYEMSLLINELSISNIAHIKYWFYICLSWFLFFLGVAAVIMGFIIAICNML